MTPLEVYTSDKPLLFMTNAAAGYWLCVTCIPGTSPSSIGAFRITQVECVYYNALLKCSQCCKPLFPHHFNHEAHL